MGQGERCAAADEDVRARAIRLSSSAIDRRKYFRRSARTCRWTTPKRYPSRTRALAVVHRRVRAQAGLQTHAPKKRPKGHDTVRERRSPIKTIVGLNRIHQACDFVGKKYILADRLRRSRSSPPATTNGFEIYQIWRTLDGGTAEQAVAKLCAFWIDHPIPQVLRIDNAMTFRGGGKPAVVSRFLKFVLNCNVTRCLPRRTAPTPIPTSKGTTARSPRKLWARHTFAAPEEIDASARASTPSPRSSSASFAERPKAKGLRYRPCEPPSTPRPGPPPAAQCASVSSASWRAGKKGNDAIGIVVVERCIDLPGGHPQPTCLPRSISNGRCSMYSNEKLPH